MAIFHLSARHPIARSSGRSATAAAAYRAGTRICDARTGLVFDYRRRRGVVDARIQLPGGRTVADRAGFWNGVEAHHRRHDAVVAREVVVALPAELDPDERAQLAFDFAREIADEFGVAVDCALHAPSRDGDDRNHHAHLLLSACGVTADGVLGKKSERLDPIVCRRTGTADSVSWLRPRWECLVNASLDRKGSVERIDHRSHKARGIDQHPTVHVAKSGALNRLRLNSQLRKKNTRAMALKADIEKLVRIRTRLAAWAEKDAVAKRAAGRIRHDAPTVANVEAALNQVGGTPTGTEQDEDLMLWRRHAYHRLMSHGKASPEAKAAIGPSSRALINALRKKKR